jgi:hypothetical protein
VRISGHDRLGFGVREAQRRRIRTLAADRHFVYVRRTDRKRDAEALEQLSTIR